MSTLFILLVALKNDFKKFTWRISKTKELPKWVSHRLQLDISEQHVKDVRYYSINRSRRLWNKMSRGIGQRTQKASELKRLWIYHPYIFLSPFKLTIQLNILVVIDFVRIRVDLIPNLPILYPSGYFKHKSYNRCGHAEECPFY